jgi:peptide/nickel transport system permease protein
VVISTAAFVGINLLVDLLYPLLDPRLKASASKNSRGATA